MVVKRSCSFCAGEIEPGTGMMFVKRDGSVFHFCSSSCRKQQLHLGRVGHRLKWTRAHLIKRQTEQSSAAGKTSRHRPASGRLVPKSPAPTPAPRAAPEPAAEPAASATPASDAAPAVPPATAPAPARKPRAKKPKEPTESA